MARLMSPRVKPLSRISFRCLHTHAPNVKSALSSPLGYDPRHLKTYTRSVPLFTGWISGIHGEGMLSGEGGRQRSFHSAHAPATALKKRGSSAPLMTATRDCSDVHQEFTPSTKRRCEPDQVSKAIAELQSGLTSCGHMQLFSFLSPNYYQGIKRPATIETLTQLCVESLDKAGSLPVLNTPNFTVDDIRRGLKLIDADESNVFAANWKGKEGVYLFIYSDFEDGRLPALYVGASSSILQFLRGDQRIFRIRSKESSRPITRPYSSELGRLTHEAKTHEAFFLADTKGIGKGCPWKGLLRSMIEDVMILLLERYDFHALEEADKASHYDSGT